MGADKTNFLCSCLRLESCKNTAIVQYIKGHCLSFALDSSECYIHVSKSIPQYFINSILVLAEQTSNLI